MNGSALVGSDLRRKRMLDGIRQRLGRGELPPEVQAELQENLQAPRFSLRPERGRPGDSAQERFERYATYAGARGVSTDQVENLEALPEAVATYLRSQECPLRLSIAPHEKLRAAPWNLGGIEAEESLGNTKVEVGVSVADSAIAETGSLVFLSGAQSPLALCLYAPIHIAVVFEETLVGAFEDVWAMNRELYGARCMPRSTFFVSGTSATGDVGQKLVRGSSGPLCVHVIMVRS